MVPRKDNLYLRVVVAAVGLIVLAAIYILQDFNFIKLFVIGDTKHPYVVFIFNKMSRFLLNDLVCFCLIWAFFHSAKHLKLAFYVFLFELIVLLPLYFVIKLSIEGDTEISSPLLAQIHRLIVNPALMILLMISFAYQKYKNRFPSA